MTCKRCNSYAINHHRHGRDGSGEDLCDVCYWRNIAESKNFQDQLIKAQKRIIELENEVNVKHTHHVVRKLKNELNQANERIKMLIAAGDMMEPYTIQQAAELWAKARENK